MTRNTSIGLIAGGLAAVAVGGIGAVIAYRAADRAASISEFAASFDNRLIDVNPDLTAMWLLIVLAALGAIAAVAGLATLPKPESLPPGTEVQAGGLMSPDQG